jgi:hypothetical protein
VIGAIVLCRGRRRLGALTVLAGLLATALELLVVVPALSPDGRYGYWTQWPGAGHRTAGWWLRLPLHLVTPVQKEYLLVLLLSPTLLLALRSPLLLVAVPTLLWRLLSEDPMYWSPHFHYSAVLMPVVSAAFVDVLIRLRRARSPVLRRTPGPLLAAGLVITLGWLPNSPVVQLGSADFWRTPPRVAATRSVLGRIPSGARVAAGNHLVPQLTARCTVIEFGTVPGRPAADWHTADWIVVDQRTPYPWPISAQQVREQLAAARADGYRTVLDEQGLVLLHRP